jgi:ATP-dependent Clp protease adaptor protein ClpS
MIVTQAMPVCSRPTISHGTPVNPSDGDSVVAEKQRLRAEPPKMYQVLMLNDDFTPMEFVVYALQEFFGKDREAATQIMLKIHLEGRGVCGVYSRDIAVSKVEKVSSAAKAAGHPLQCVCEPVT